MSGQVSDRRVRRLRRYWDKHASTYDEQIAVWERRLFPDGRHWVCTQATGEVLEVAIGSGRNLRYYPADVHLTGIDLSPEMLALARRQAGRLGHQVDLRLGDAQDLDLPDASFDTVVCTLVLCGIPDERRAIAEMWRVLRPGGRLLLLDHIVGEPWWVRALQWLMELYTRPFQDEYMRRRPLPHVKSQGFEIERHERSKLGVIEQLAARKPAADPGPTES